MSELSAYFITFTCYGERLHGDPRSSVDRRNNSPDTPPLAPNSRRVAFEKARLAHAPTRLDAAQRECVAAAIKSVCEHRGWQLHALNVRTNHVHVVVSSDRAPEPTMGLLKSWATRYLRDAGLAGRDQRLWTRHGSTKHLFDDQDVIDASTYVLDLQGTDLGGRYVATEEL